MLYAAAAIALLLGLVLGGTVHPLAGAGMVVLAVLFVVLAVVRAQRGRPQGRAPSRRRAGRDSSWAAGGFLGDGGSGHGGGSDSGGSSGCGGGSSCGGGCGGGGGGS